MLAMMPVTVDFTFKMCF